jgi:hypothetical protein
MNVPSATTHRRSTLGMQGQRFAVSRVLELSLTLGDNVPEQLQCKQMLLRGILKTQLWVEKDTQVQSSSLFFVCLFVCLAGWLVGFCFVSSAGDLTQGLTHATQVPYHWSPAPAPLPVLHPSYNILLEQCSVGMHLARAITIHSSKATEDGNQRYSR